MGASEAFHRCQALVNFVTCSRPLAMASDSLILMWASGGF